MITESLREIIIAEFGSISEFASHVHETLSQVSKVVNYRDRLNPQRQRVWAEILERDPKELFE